ncbi:MAG: Capsule polysaccharide biosynthesis protein [Candidatus Accumulibacter appositus]|uniref:Capsule polysaccharide biosynthesis protein n=1 Tax=Candidatus Accumulibacter appositus TaxID=1454003 RepID=A0A011PNS3_9PROT|nr:hypothetical protein [Accumulibacter sp.]EXI78677.1 MAG: Capsule polysaccharide biosynthesis protein [Candidatus Accumulibacter appositus]HRF03337.1 hypothetical protein [Accumulibacter sp.]
MFLSFLLPFPARGLNATYLCVLYKQITHFTPQEIAFVGSAEYFSAPEDFVRSGRVDASRQSEEYFKFRVPSCDEMERYTVYRLSDDLFESWQAITPDVDQMMRRILTERCEQLEVALRGVLIEASRDHPFEAILTWCNVPSLSVVAAEFALPVIHAELGPLREPWYQWTAYFDFSGVNGRTESRRRFKSFELSRQKEAVPLLSTRELRELFVIEPAQREPRSDPEFDIGLPLQVENDTNIIAFANGWTNDQLIAAASAIYGRGKTLIRRHPGGLRDYTGVAAQVDKSLNSIAFIQRCARVATINSSVGLESLLFDRETIILGDNPCAFAALDRLDGQANATPRPDRLQALNFLLFGYLVPYEFLFDRDYLRWRLSEPSETEIYLFHLEYVQERQRSIQEGPRFRASNHPLRNRGLLAFWRMRAGTLEHRVTTLRGEYAAVGQALQETYNSLSWRLTKPLRWLHQKWR